MKSYEKVKALQDEEGHWHVIPDYMYLEWLEIEKGLAAAEEYSEEWNAFIDQMEALFGAYRTGGDLNNTQLYVETNSEDHSSDNYFNADLQPETLD